MKRFNFKTQLKEKDLDWLLSFKNIQIDLMLDFLACDRQSDADKQNRYISYIDDAINKLKIK